MEGPAAVRLAVGPVDPRFVRDGEKMLAQGLQIVAQGPNVMLKLPGSKEGYEVMEEVTARGISTNNTTSFTVSQYLRCRAAVSAGLFRAQAAGVDLSKWRSVITHMSARLGELSDWKTEAKARGIELTLPEIRDGEEAVLKRATPRQEHRPPSKMLQCSMRVERTAPRQDRQPPHPGLRRQRMVYTCRPATSPSDGERRRARPVRPNAIDREPKKASLEKLVKLRASARLRFDGMRTDQVRAYAASGDRSRVRRGDAADGGLVRMTLEGRGVRPNVAGARRVDHKAHG